MPGSALAIERDLRRLVSGDVRFDEESRVMFSRAACLFEIEPLGVVAPADAEDVRRVVAYCHRHELALTARGAGSSVAGQAIGPGIILDFRPRMNRLLGVDGRTARVQPGLILSDLNRELGRHGFFFPPDPSSAAFCTLGGMINTNAGGAHSVRWGTTRDWVRSLDVVLDTGERAVLGRVNESAGRLGAILDGLKSLLSHLPPAVLERRPRAPKNSSGYHIWDIVHPDGVDLHRLYSGSEGTLAVLVEAVIGIEAVPPPPRTLLLSYADPEAALRAVPSLLSREPRALEFLDETTVRILVEAFPHSRGLLGGFAAHLICEFDREPGAGARADRRLDLDEARAARVWEVRRLVSPALERRPGPRRSTRVVEDVCVPPERLAEYVRVLKDLLATYGFEAAIFGHAGSGNLHANVFADTSDADELARLQTFATELYRAVREMGGTMSGEHGDGLLRAQWMREFFGPAAEVFERIKAIFDPKNILNPGKKVGPRGYRFPQDLRSSRRPGARAGELADLLARCNGCGRCRTYCPVVQEEPSEFSMPRAKVNLLDALERGRLSELPSRTRFLLDLSRCGSCRRCLQECPAAADLPRIAEIAGAAGAP